MKNLNLLGLILFLLFTFNQHIFCQKIDSTFQVKVLNDGLINALEVQTNGKILVGGHFTFFNEENVSQLVRLNEDGSLDLAFSVKLDGAIRVLKVLRAGQILVGGDFKTYNGESTNALIKIDAQGQLIHSFEGVERIYFTPKIIEKEDGKILVAGIHPDDNNPLSIRLFNADGTLDSSFNPPAPTIGIYVTAAIQNDGKILVGGQFGNHAADALYPLMRVFPDGTVDESFSYTPKQNNAHILNLEVFSNGHIFLHTNEINSYCYVLGQNGNRLEEYSVREDDLFPLNKMHLSENKDTIQFMTYHSEYRIVQGQRLSTLGYYTDGVLRGYATDQKGNRFFGGKFKDFYSNPAASIAKMSNMGFDYVDTDFNEKASFYQPGLINTIHQQQDGNYLIGGRFSKVGGTTVNNIARLLPNADLDTTFYTGAIATEHTIKYITSLENGDIFVTGATANNIHFTDRRMNGIIKLNSRGLRKDDFNLNFSWRSSGNVDNLSIASDGKLYITGTFGIQPTNYNQNIARLHANGNLDEDFQYSTNIISSTFKRTTIDNKSRTLLYGERMTYNNLPSNGANLLRIGTEEEIDESFQILDSLNLNGHYRINTNSILTQSDNKIIISGGFNMLNETPIPSGILRLKENGELDPSFQAEEGFMRDSIPINAVLYPLTNDKMLAVGGNIYNGRTVNSPIVLNANGRFNQSLSPLLERGRLTAVLGLDNNTILIGGNLYNSTHPQKASIFRVILDADDDNDGVSNNYDRCPRGDDASDLDEDGIPDLCDCNPNDPNNTKVELEEALDDGEYYADFSINSSSTIIASSEVLFKAGYEVVLKEGFETEDEVAFDAEVGYCDNSTDENSIIERTAKLGVSDLNLLVYPNPSTTNTAITIEGEGKKDITIKIFDFLGRQIKMAIVPANTPYKLTEIFLHQGYYFIHAETKDRIITQKLLIY